MKPKAIFLTFILSCISIFICHAQSPKVDSATVTWSKVYGDVKSAITSLADGLKVGADHVYTVLVRQQVINAWMYIILGFFALIFTFACWRYLCWFNKTDIDVDDAPGWVILAIILVILSLVLWICTLAHIDDIMVGFTNPEYGAIHEILSRVNKN